MGRLVPFSRLGLNLLKVVIMTRSESFMVREILMVEKESQKGVGWREEGGGE